MRELRSFEEFDHHGYHITTDLGSAWFDGGRIHIEGRATRDGETHQVTVSVTPEDTPEFNTSISASDGELTQNDFSFDGELAGVEIVETGESL